MNRLIWAGIAMTAMPVMAFADDMFAGVSTIADSNGETRIMFESLNPDIMRMEAGERVSLNFGPGYEAELDRIGDQSLGARVWVGRLADHTIHNRVLLTQTNGFVFGRIQTEDGLWMIVPEAGGHRIMQMPEGGEPLQNPNDVLIPNYDLVVQEGRERVAEIEEGTADAVAVGSNGIIDIAVFYSQGFSARWGLATGGRVQYLMAVLDQALIDSDTGLRARLVHLDSVTLDNDAANQSETLNNLSGDPNGDTPVTQDLSALRAAGVTYGADLVAILQRSLTGQSSCGLAWGIGQPSTNGVINANSARFGYSVSADWIADTDNPAGQYSFCSDVTFAHEIGHNLGFAHNVEDAGGTPGGGVRAYAHGHRVDCTFGTIMSYQSGAGITCPQGAPNGPGGEAEALYFSNPDINLCPNGAACGIAAPGQEQVAFAQIDGPSTSDPADNARAAREVSLNVVSFRPEAPRVVSSVLPITRSVTNGTTATAFATIINPTATGSTATGCGLRLAGATPAQFSYQTTTPANALTGTANTPVSIAAGAAQNFLFSVTSAADFVDGVGTPGFYPSTNNESDLFIEAFCDNRRSAEYTLGLNSLTFRSTAAGSADIVALATSGDPGRVNVPTTGNFVGVFAVAISNVGNAGNIVVSADTGGRTLAINNIEICPTNPATGACTAARAATQNLAVGANGTATFGIFVRGTGAAISNDPARNRVFVRFAEGGNAVGATSVAVRTQ
ncbi:M12 family metallo-peptidase [Hyphobacterium indicum]|uniref:M12 family metallo-peptidase n=1 Tax=Hyphobacterium indicum TaxID=2162714 RepID=UPI000D64D15B|nr:M12 family metallo-peptidase [Hyphobacterium indicum]